jgi:rRNA maturation RNase YbeY
MIKFYKEGTNYNFPDKSTAKSWIKQVVDKETNKELFAKDICFIFCSDEYILEVNSKYLNHNYLTDVITFNYNEGKYINGDVFIGVNTVRENSVIYNTTFDEEMRRVVIHAVLHLLGYDDLTKDERSLMREKENLYLYIYKELKNINDK